MFKSALRVSFVITAFFFGALVHANSYTINLPVTPYMPGDDSDTRVSQQYRTAVANDQLQAQMLLGIQVNVDDTLTIVFSDKAKQTFVVKSGLKTEPVPNTYQPSPPGTNPNTYAGAGGPVCTTSPLVAQGYWQGAVVGGGETDGPTSWMWIFTGFTGGETTCA